MIYIAIVLLFILIVVGYFVADSLYFQKLHPDDLVTYQPMYDLEDGYKGEDK